MGSDLIFPLRENRGLLPFPWVTSQGSAAAVLWEERESARGFPRFPRRLGPAPSSREGGPDGCQFATPPPGAATYSNALESRLIRGRRHLHRPTERAKEPYFRGAHVGGRSRSLPARARGGAAAVEGPGHVVEATCGQRASIRPLGIGMPDRDADHAGE